MKPPLVTTIIATFNRAEMLQRAIRSVQAQTLDAVEILVLDDAGTDGTQAMMRQLAAEDPRITYVRRPKNLGIGANFGDGLSRVATPYCSFLSDDDYLLPDFYQTCLAVLDSDRDLAIASGGLILTYEDGSTISTLDKWHEFGRLIPAQSVGRLLSNMTAAWSAALIRTEAAKELGLNERLSIAFDMLLMLQICSKYPTWLFAQPFAIQRVDKTTISGAAPPRELIREWRTLDEIFSKETAPALAGQADGIAAQVTAGVVRVRRYLEREDVRQLEAPAAEQLQAALDEAVQRAARLDQAHAELEAVRQVEAAASDQLRAELDEALGRATRLEEELRQAEDARDLHAKQGTAAEEALTDLRRQLASANEQHSTERVRGAIAASEMRNQVDKLRSKTGDLERQVAQMAHRQVEEADRAAIARAELILREGRLIRAVRGVHLALMALTSAVRRRQLLLGLRVMSRAKPRAVWRTLFSPAYYLAHNPDVASAGIPPAMHFLLVGHSEGRDPSPLFSVSRYLKSNADVAAAGINALAHYALFGAREGRIVSPATETRPTLESGGMPTPRAELVNTPWPAEAPLVSVVIPCFNYGTYLSTALASVLGQTWTDLEVIVVEGGSTDPESVRAVRHIESDKPSRVRFLYRERPELVGSNRNFGIEHARGRYVVCLDPDDTIKPTYLEVALYLTEACAYDLVYPNVHCVGESEAIWITEDATLPAMLNWNLVPTVAMFRKSAWAAAGGFRDWGSGDDHVPEDWDFWLRLLGQGSRAKSIQVPLMDYRVHSGSLSAAARPGSVEQRMKIVEANQELIETWQLPADPGLITVRDGDRNLADYRRRSPATRTVLLALPFATVGGAERLLASLAHGLVDQGRDVVVTTSLELQGSMPEALEMFHAVTPNTYDLAHLFAEPDDRRRFVMHLIQRYGVETIVIAGSRFAYELLPEIRERWPDIAIVDQLFNDVGHVASNREFANAIDLTIVPSEAVSRTLLESYGEARDRVRVIPHGIPPRAAPLRGLSSQESVELPSEGALVGFFGRLSDEKAPDTFVEIARRLTKASQATFLMTGEGPLSGSITKLVAKHRLKDRLLTLGFVPDVAPLLDRVDIVVIPSRLDGMPLIALEAMNAGKPVVASAVGSLPEVIDHGLTGFLCEPGDIDAFCRFIQQLLADPALRRRMGEAARENVQRDYSFEAMLQRYTDAFDWAKKAAGYRIGAKSSM